MKLMVLNNVHKMCDITLNVSFTVQWVHFIIVDNIKEVIAHWMSGTWPCDVMIHFTDLFMLHVCLRGVSSFVVICNIFSRMFGGHIVWGMLFCLLPVIVIVEPLDVDTSLHIWQAYSTHADILNSFQTCHSFYLILKIVSVRTLKYIENNPIFYQSE